MSQVKKLQSGGNTKLGSLTIDGTRYDATPEMIQALSDYLRPSSSATVNLAGINAALRNGADLVYDSLGNTISGMSGKWTGVSDKQDQKRTSGDDNDFNRALSLLSSFSYTAPKKKGEEISGNKIFFEYGDNGEYLPNSGINNSIFDRISKIGRHLSDEASGKYAFASKYTPAQIDAIRSLYNKYGGWASLESHANDVMSRAKQGRDKLTADDLAFLKTFNIAEGADEDENGDPTYKKAKAITSDDWKKWGFGTGDANDKLYQQLKGKVVLNDDGSLSLVEGADWGLDDYSKGGYYFNQSFFDNTIGSEKYNPFRGLTIHNGKLYSNKSTGLSKLLNLEGGYNDLYRKGDFAGANAIIRTDYASNEHPALQRLTADQYLPGFSGKNIGYSSWLDKNGNQAMMYVDFDNPINNPDSPYVDYNAQYALFDPYGNRLEDQIDRNYVKDLEASPFNTFKQIITRNPEDPYRNYYYIDATTSNPNTGEFGNAGFRLYVPKDGTGDYIYQDDSENGPNIRIPAEIAERLFGGMSPEQIADKIGSFSADQRKRWNQFIKGLDNPDNLSGSWLTSLWGLTGNFWSQPSWNIFQNMWDLSDEDREYIDKWFDTNRTRRKQTVRRPYITSQKNGGVLKFVQGGTSGGSTESRAVSERRLNTDTVQNPKNAAAFTDLFTKKGRENWTDDDTADVVALVTDLGSLGLAFAPGAGIASAGVGAVGSLARFKADLGRGTENAGWNLALNLGMDAATALPLLGGAAKGWKIVRGIRKMLPTIIKAASVYGLGSTVVNSAQKIASGKEWTVRDVANVANGLTAAIGVSRTGLLPNKKIGRKAGTTEMPVIKGKENTPDLKLTEAQLTSIQHSKPTDKQSLAEAIAKAKNETKAAGASDVTAADIIDKYNLDPFLKEGKRKFLGLIGPRKEGTIEGLEAKTTKGKLGIVDRESRWFPDWVYGISPKQRVFREQLTGGETGKGSFKYENVYKGTKAPVATGFKEITIGRGNNKIKFTADEVAQIVKKKKSLYNAIKEKNNTLSVDEITKLSKEFRKTQKQNWKMEKTWEGQKPGWWARIDSRTISSKQLPFTPKNMPSSLIDIKYHSGMGITRPMFLNVFKPENYQENQYQTPAGFAPLYVTPYKKGGKIVKAQPGLKTFKTFNTELELPDYTKIENTPNYVMKSGPSSQTDVFTGKTTINTPGINNAGENWDAKTQNTTNAFNTATESLKGTNPSLYYQMKANELLKGVTGNTSTILDSEDDPQGGSIKPKTYFNPNFAPVLDLFHYFKSRGEQNSIAELGQEYLRNYKYNSAFHKSIPRYISDNKKNDYIEAGKRMLSVIKPTTSDYHGYVAQQLANFKNVNDFFLRGDLAESNSQSNYFKNVVEPIHQENELNDFNAKENKRVEENKNALVGVGIEQNKKIQNTLREDALFKGLEQQAEGLFQDRYRNIFYNNADKLYADYNDWQRIYNNIADKNSPQALNAANKLNEIDSALRGLQYKTSQQGIVRVKKGGKTNYHKSEFSRDPIPEIMIENTKAAHRFAEKLSVETLRMLSKIKPFHVS